MGSFHKHKEGRGRVFKSTTLREMLSILRLRHCMNEVLAGLQARY